VSALTADRSFPPWTIGLAAVVALLNIGLFTGGPAADWLRELEFERRAVLDGETWRVLTANLVHFDQRHFFLDAGVFLVLGWMSERSIGRAYPLLALWIALVVGVAGIWFLPDGTHMRGLSGVNAGQFAAALWVEIGLAGREPRRWLWTVPAAGFFLVWIGYGAATGRSLWMGDDARVAGWAHVTGAIAAVAFMCARAIVNRRKQRRPATANRPAQNTAGSRQSC
jgi:rhomboid family GlyGly-CTERM serine protease